MAHAGTGLSDGDTVRRLLEAAAHEFARHGFAAARVRDIVDAAGVNLAAVNYHFGGKEGLYRATLERLARLTQLDVPREAPEARGLPAEEQLRVFTRLILSRFLGGADASPMSRMLAHELLDPTPAFDAMLREVVGPQYARLEQIVHALLGPKASAEDVAFASFSVVGQWAFFLFGRRAFEHLFPEMARDATLIGRLSERISDFSIAALRARREALEGGRRKPRPKPAVNRVPAAGTARTKTGPKFGRKPAPRRRSVKSTPPGK